MSEQVTVAVIGGGPAGLMAADYLSQRGIAVTVLDAMPSVGRKFLLAGIGGLNITHAEPLPDFLTRYAERQSLLTPVIQAFSPEMIQHWIHSLGVKTFVGSSGRVFPAEMKAAPLLRAWLHRLRNQGVKIAVRHRWLGWTPEGALRFQTPQGEKTLQAQAVVLALGGASWPRLGSDGAWLPWLTELSVPIAPFRPANCGFEVAWSDYLREHYAGTPLKTVVLHYQDAHGQAQHKAGELVLSEQGLEGGLLYACSALLREQVAGQGYADIHLDLAPARSYEWLLSALAKPKGSKSLASHWQRMGLKDVKAALVREALPREQWTQADKVAKTIKALPIRLQQPRPLAEAISSAGGVVFEGLTPHFMLKQKAGVFCAGEMLDWEAPTGGYLLTACLATGRWAAQGVHDYLQAQQGASTTCN